MFIIFRITAYYHIKWTCRDFQHRVLALLIIKGYFFSAGSPKKKPVQNMKTVKAPIYTMSALIRVSFNNLNIATKIISISGNVDRNSLISMIIKKLSASAGAVMGMENIERVKIILKSPLIPDKLLREKINSSISIIRISS